MSGTENGSVLGSEADDIELNNVFSNNNIYFQFSGETINISNNSPWPTNPSCDASGNGHTDISDSLLYLITNQPNDSSPNLMFNQFNINDWDF